MSVDSLGAVDVVEVVCLETDVSSRDCVAWVCVVEAAVELVSAGVWDLVVSEGVESDSVAA